MERGIITLSPQAVRQNGRVVKVKVIGGYVERYCQSDQDAILLAVQIREYLTSHQIAATEDAVEEILLREL